MMKFLKITSIALAVTLGANAVAATWSGPAGAPPGSNAEAPIHTGSDSQTKAGALTVGGVHSLTNGNFDGVVIANGLGQSQSFLMTGINDVTSDVVLRKDGINAYIWPWGTGYQSNTVIVGNGASAPTSLSVTGTLSAAAFKLTNGAAAGKVLTSDASGNATWQTAAAGGSGGGGTVGGSGTAGRLPKWATASTLGDSIIGDNGAVATVNGALYSNSGIGSGGDIVAGGTLAASDSGGTGVMLSGFGQVAIFRDGNAMYLWPNGVPTAQGILNVGSGGHPLNLNVTGALSAVNIGVSGNFNIAPNAGAGKVLVSDSAGNATWQTPAAGSSGAPAYTPPSGTARTLWTDMNPGYCPDNTSITGETYCQNAGMECIGVGDPNGTSGDTSCYTVRRCGHPGSQASRDWGSGPTSPGSPLYSSVKYPMCLVR